MPQGREGAFNRVRCPQVFPVLGREVVECHERNVIFGHAGDGLLAFCAVARGNGIEGRDGDRLRLGHDAPLHPCYAVTDFRVKLWSASSRLLILTLMLPFGVLVILTGYRRSRCSHPRR